MARLLFIRYKKSRDILEGGEQCSQKNLDAYRSVLGDDNVDVLYIHDETRGHSAMDYLRALVWFPFGYHFGLTPLRVRSIVKKAEGYDFLHIDRSVFGIIAKKAKKAGYKGRVTVFFHNIEKTYFKAKFSGKIGESIVCRCADRNDCWSCEWADKVIALNERDSASLEKTYGRKADIIAPILFKDRCKKAAFPSEMTSAKPSCLFVGAYFAANNEGIEWFIRNVYPHVNITLKIVGRGMDRLNGSGWLCKDIELVSDAPSLEPYFMQSDLMILPIFKGSGMKVKTCESLMYGKNILATDEAWEGYELDCEKAGGRCNSAEEFIAKIKEFENNPKPRFNAYSRQVYLEKYSDSNAAETFKAALYD